jgi:sulfite reductase alpha subunit-like flavoprotein
MTNAPVAFVDDQTTARTLLILYATETGNAEDTAFRVARQCKRIDFHARIASVDTYPLVSGVVRIRRM